MACVVEICDYSDTLARRNAADSEAGAARDAS